MAKKGSPAPFDGLIIVDKPSEWTSHDVVGRLRRLAGTRRVGHGGTLDPMATGVLVCGVGKATKLLGLIGATDKSYDATIRLGVTTTTDDADGEILSATGVGSLGSIPSSDVSLGDVALADVARADVARGVERLTGEIMQRPSSVSAIKINGERAYKRVRAGEEVVLPERPVTISQFDVRASRVAEAVGPEGKVPVLDLDVTVTCSTGTYIRALARDLGADLGVGGHLTSLRRTRVGAFALDSAHTLDQLASDLSWLPLETVCDTLFTRIDLDSDAAGVFRHGGAVAWPSESLDTGTIAVFAPDATILGLAESRSGRLAPTVVWQPA